MRSFYWITEMVSGNRKLFNYGRVRKVDDFTLRWERCEPIFLLRMPIYWQWIRSEVSESLNCVRLLVCNSNQIFVLSAKSYRQILEIIFFWLKMRVFLFIINFLLFQRTLWVCYWLLCDYLKNCVLFQLNYF